MDRSHLVPPVIGGRRQDRGRLDFANADAVCAFPCDYHRDCSSTMDGPFGRLSQSSLCTGGKPCILYPARIQIDVHLSPGSSCDRHGCKQAGARSLKVRGAGGVHMYPYLCRRRGIDTWQIVPVASRLESTAVNPAHPGTHSGRNCPLRFAEKRVFTARVHERT